ncbi:MAG: hypothetical protein AB1486_16720, partial [Planctomycetota bacterium]
PTPPPTTNTPLPSAPPPRGGPPPATLLETLESDILIEHNTQDDFVNQRTVRRLILGTSTFAELTEDVNVTVELRDEIADVTGLEADTIPDPSEKVAELLIVYQPSDQLTTEVNLEWRDTYAGTGLDQRYRVDWLPFPDGTVDVQLDARREVAAVAETTIDSYLALTRWNFNPSAFLEVNYGVQIPHDIDRTDTVTVALNVRF